MLVNLMKNNRWGLLRYFAVCLMCVAWFWSATLQSAEQESQEADQSVPVVLVWGDSLSAAYGIAVEDGWVSLLQQRLGDGFKVVNGSISGETTKGGLARLPAALEVHQPDYLLLELGANDGLRGLPVKHMRSNLDDMLKQAQEKEVQAVLIGIHIPPNYGILYTKKFDQVYQDLAQQYELPFIPFLLEGVAQDFDLMQADGLHPTAEAQPVIFDHVWKTLEPVFYPEKAEAQLDKQMSLSNE